MFLCLVHALNLSKKAQAPDKDILIVVAKIRSVYKELHADHETGAADNK